jgi:hypothetical protein
VNQVKSQKSKVKIPLLTTHYSLLTCCCLLAVALILLSCRTPMAGPEPVGLVQPGPDSTARDGNVVFAWDSVASAASYELQIDDKTTFITPVFDTVGVIGWSLTHFLPDGPYHWRVRARSRDSIWGEWAGARAFLVASYRIAGQVRTRGYPEELDIAGNYAYVADCQAGLSIYQLNSTSGNPVLVGSIMDTTNSAFGVSVAGHYAYVAYGRKQLQVVDIAKLDSLKMLGSIGYTTGYAYDIRALDTTTVVVANHAKFSVFDVTDPSFPILLYEPHAMVRAVAVRDSTAFLACEQLGLNTMTVTKHAEPVTLGAVRTLGEARDVALEGRYAYIADGRNGLTVVDIGDPANPQVVANCPIPGKGYANKVAVHDSLVLVADEVAGVAIIDITNPVAPLLRSVIKTDYAMAVAFHDGGKILATDRDAGLLVIEKENEQ